MASMNQRARSYMKMFRINGAYEEQYAKYGQQYSQEQIPGSLPVSGIFYRCSPPKNIMPLMIATMPTIAAKVLIVEPGVSQHQNTEQNS